jgi:REP element-mobilizing transposase RayT
MHGHDYADIGVYFVTICAYEMAHIFGNIQNVEMRLNGIGEMLADEWMKTAAMRPYVKLDEWVVMPNHFHGILWIVGSDERRGDGFCPVGA